VPLSSDIPVITRKLESAGTIEELFAAHYGVLTRVIYRVVGDAGWAEELASEAFWKLHRQPPSSDQNLAGWLCRTGLRLALDNLRKRKRRAHYEALTPAPEGAESPEEALQRVERQARVRQVLAAMKPRQAELLVLRSEGHSLAELASILHLNANSVGTLLTRADAAFRKEYVKRYGEN
jgi:RNA polymerase sigma-70 factor, ECF subfamily